ncbi:MAG: thioredoxin domain-containing protein [Deltaproteobacteria bacterium]|nr:thioredoxin domain-containing protein [Deltaproteobacteria bacterium]
MNTKHIFKSMTFTVAHHFFNVRKYNAFVMICTWMAAFHFAGCTDASDETCTADVAITPIETSAYVQFDPFLQSSNAVFKDCGNRQPRLDNRFSPFKGGGEAPSLVVEHYSALDCPHCASFAAYVDSMLATQSKINARVRFYFHHYTFSRALDTHMAAFAVSQQSMEKFWQFHDIIYSNIYIHRDYQNLRDIAQHDLQLDMSLYDAATSLQNESGMRNAGFLQHEKDIANANCIPGTPTVYICGEPVSDWRKLEGIILSYLRNEN